MTVETFVMGFALILVGILLTTAAKNAIGRLFIAAATGLLGAFGLGFYIGMYSGGSAYWRSLLSLAQGMHDADAAGLKDIIRSMTELELRPQVGMWTFLVTTLMVGGGLAAFAELLVAYIRDQRFKAAEAAKREAGQHADKQSGSASSE